MRLKIKNLLFIILILLLQACSSTQEVIKSSIQTDAATQIENYKKSLLDKLILYKNKLDLRNPNAYNKSIMFDLRYQIKNQENKINIIYKNKKLIDYKEYFYYAFLKEKIRNRNDFLILGMYKLIYKAYLVGESYKITALQYDSNTLQSLYKYLQILKWKIKVSKNKNGNYLFNTWQNNWQLELNNKKLNNLNIIKNLPSIKNKKETIFDCSNTSFEVLISLMLQDVEYTLRKINVEPYEMGFDAVTSFIFLI